MVVHRLVGPSDTKLSAKVGRNLNPELPFQARCFTKLSVLLFLMIFNMLLVNQPNSSIITRTRAILWESSPDPTTQRNLFLSLDGLANFAGAVAVLGHAGIGMLKSI
jgi:hypothetical protein